MDFDSRKVASQSIGLLHFQQTSFDSSMGSSIQLMSTLNAPSSLFWDLAKHLAPSKLLWLHKVLVQGAKCVIFLLNINLC